jgi:hypothetical protein
MCQKLHERAGDIPQSPSGSFAKLDELSENQKGVGNRVVLFPKIKIKIVYFIEN